MPRKDKRETTIFDLRSRCRALGVVPNWWNTSASSEEQRPVLSRSELEPLVRRLELRRAAALRYRLGPRDAGAAPGRVAHCFWSNKDPASWDGPAAPPVAHQIGLFSAVTAAKLDVTVWTYHTGLSGIPPLENAVLGQDVGRIVVRHAADLWPTDEARTFLEEGGRIQHVADIVRLEAVARWPGPAVPAGDDSSASWSAPPKAHKGPRPLVLEHAARARATACQSNS